MKLIGTANWPAECMCCGENEKRIFVIEEKFASRTVESLLCADCAAEEEAIEHYERERSAP